MSVLKVGVEDVWYDPLLLREKLGVEGSLLIVWHCAKGRVYGESVSSFPLHFNADIFSSPSVSESLN